MTTPLLAVPVKAFGVAKQRLASDLSPEARRQVGQALAKRTLTTIARSGADTLVLAGDALVAKWAARNGFESRIQTSRGLNGAAFEIAELAPAAWGVVFADLPLLETGDIDVVLEQLSGGPVIGPSRDGGTNLLCGRGAPPPFAYGVGSFHRHMAAFAATGEHPTVVVRTGIALDLDTSDDLHHASRLSGWLRSLLEEPF